jgi:hypothetical protein
MDKFKLGRTTINFPGHHITATGTQLVKKHVDVDVIQQFPPWQMQATPEFSGVGKIL